MKFFLIIFTLTLTLFSTTAFSNTNWKIVDDLISYTDRKEYLNSFDILNDSTYVCCVENGDGIFSMNQFHKSIRITKDGGTSYDTLLSKRGLVSGSSLYPRINKIKILNFDTIIAADCWGNILRTTDAGVSWDSIALEYRDSFTEPEELYISDFKIHSNGQGIITYLSDSLLAYTTYDFGKTWNKLSCDTVDDTIVSSIYSGDIKGDTIVLTGIDYSSRKDADGEGTTRLKSNFYISMDKGESWDIIDGLRNGEVYALKLPVLHFLADGQLLMMGSRVGYYDKSLDSLDLGPIYDGERTSKTPPRIYKSNDLGKTWQLKYKSEMIGSATTLVSSRSDIYQDSIILFSTSHSFLLSTDFGESWNESYNGNLKIGGDVRLVSQACIIDKDNYLAWTNGSKVCQYNVNTFTSINEVLNNEEVGVLFPNPVSVNNYIYVDLKEEVINPKITIYDYTGNIISKDEINQAVQTNQTLRLKIDNRFDAGVFMIVIESNKKIKSVQKLIVK
jgi:hypothetical protein